MPTPSRGRFALSGLVATLLAAAATLSQAQALTKPLVGTPTDAEPTGNSRMDAPLFYQLLIGELELRTGEPGTAFEVILDAARRTRDDDLFKRAVEIAIQGRALDQALSATRSWRVALPQSLDALRLQIQILAAGDRTADLGEPLRALLKNTPAAERAGLIEALPRFLQRSRDAKRVASVLTDVLRPFAEAADTRVAARVATGRAWMNAGDLDIALALARDANKLDNAAAGPALLALELMRRLPDAESVLTQHLAGVGVSGVPLRLVYSRVLTSSQRYADAARQLELVVRDAPQEPAAHLTLGVIYAELKQPKEAEAALLRYLQLATPVTGQSAAPPTNPDTPTPATPAAQAAVPADDDDDDDTPGTERGVSQAWLSLALLAEQRGDFKAAEGWLGKVGDPGMSLEVQGRRASILARQGKVSQARELIRQMPERKPEDARAKLVAEAAMLRDVKRWKEAYEVLSSANQRFADDADLLYEQAMVAEKTDKLVDMERLLRRVMALKPESPHAHNALGYSLADRGQRLPEARELIARALELSPGDPFITDSLGWVEFKLGRKEEALRLLRAAHNSRPDAEIGAHLGEVLWSLGQKEEARTVWRDARQRDAGNEVLRETLARLRAEP